MLKEKNTGQNRKKNRLRWRYIGSLVLLVILLIAILVLVTANSENRYNSDFLKFYLSARFLMDGESIYTPLSMDSIPEDIEIEPELFDNPILANINPPLLSLLMVPMGRLSYPNAFLAWWIISLIFGLISVFLIYSTYRGNFLNLHIFELAIIFLFFFPTLVTFLSGQISTLLLFLLVVAWNTARRGKDQLAGIALGIAFSLKLFTGLFIPVFIFQKRCRLLAWYLGTFLVVNLFSILVVGFDDHIAYLKTLSSVTWYSATWNTSIMGFLTRIFGGSESIPLIDSPIIGTVLYFTLFLLILIMLIWFAYKSDKYKIQVFDLVFALTIVSMLLISPLGWIYYYVLLILPVVVAWSAAKRLKDRVLQGTIIAAWILCTIPFPLLQGPDIRNVDIFAWAGFPLYGLLLLFVTIGLLAGKTITVKK